VSKSKIGKAGTHFSLFCTEDSSWVWGQPVLGQADVQAQASERRKTQAVVSGGLHPRVHILP